MARSGHFRDRARFERLPETYDANGDQTGSWDEVATVWGDLMETPGREDLVAGRLQPSKTATLRVRASVVMAGITGADRVVARGQTWNIVTQGAQVGRQGRVLEFKLTTGDAST